MKSTTYLTTTKRKWTSLGINNDKELVRYEFEAPVTQYDLMKDDQGRRWWRGALVS